MRTLPARIAALQITTVGLVAGLMVGPWLQAQTAQQPPAQPSQRPPQPSEIETTITGGDNSTARLALPDFIAISKDAESVAIAKTIGQVLWDDLNFEREFGFIPRDTYASIPAATSFS